MTRHLGARSGRPRRNLRDLIPELPPRKEHADCCEARRDHRGRLPIGYCSSGCIRRPSNWARS